MFIDATTWHWIAFATNLVVLHGICTLEEPSKQRIRASIESEAEQAAP
jgi:hypothetical protein